MHEREHLSLIKMSLAERRVLPRNKFRLALRLGAIDIDAGFLQPSDVMFASRFDDVKGLLTVRQTFVETATSVSSEVGSIRRF